MLRVPYRILGGGSNVDPCFIDCYAQNNIKGSEDIPSSEFSLRVCKFFSPLVTLHWKELRKLKIHSVGLFTIVCVT